MRTQPDRSRPLLRELKAGGARRLYAVHPGALAASAWDAFAGRLPQDVGFALFDLHNVPDFFSAALDPSAVPVSVEKLAARCLDELTAGHPDGLPFSLIGWSFGGVVAYEMAEQLDAAGHGGALDDLIVLDSIAPVPAFKRGDDLLEPRMLLRWFAMYLGAKRGRPLTVDLPPVADRDEGLLMVLDAAIRQGVLQAGTELAGLRKLYQAYFGGLSRNNRCTAPYEPAPTSRTVTLVKAEQSLLPDSGDLGWSQLSTQPLRQLTVPGDHYTMLREPSALAALSGLLADPAAA